MTKIYENPASDKLALRPDSTGLLFPLKLFESGDNVARTVFIEQFPARPLALPGLPGRLGKRYPLGDQLADLFGQVLEIAPLVSNRAAPIAHNRAMSGNTVDSRNARQPRQVGEKAPDAGVDDRNMPDEQEIACKQG